MALCFFLFLYEGSECTYAGWISSFAVLKGVTDNQGATIYPCVFWVMMTIFRFALAFASGTSAAKLKWLILMTITAGLISIAIVLLGFTEVACYVSGILFGVALSSVYPLVLSIPLEYGL